MNLVRLAPVGLWVDLIEGVIPMVAYPASFSTPFEPGFRSYY